MKLWEKYSTLVLMVKNDHSTKGVVGGPHDFYHALMVAQYGQMIAEGERVGELAWLAGLCHNTDYMFGEQTEERIEQYLEVVPDLSGKEKVLILEAVLNHSKKNDPADNPITVALKDADRLANSGAIHTIRAAQYFPSLPPVDLVFLSCSPTGTFRKPNSVAEHLYYCLEWEGWLRLPKAKELAARYFRERQEFLKNIEDQLRETGLYPLQAELL